MFLVYECSMILKTSQEELRTLYAKKKKKKVLEEEEATERAIV